MGAIQVIANKTQDRLVQLINGISYIFLLYYMIGFFYNIEFHGIPLIKSERKRKNHIIDVVSSAL